MRALFVGLALGALATAAHAAPAPPDWTGIYEREGGILFDPAVRVGGKLTPPLTPAFQKKYDAIMAAAAAGTPMADPGALCLPAGMPRIMVMTYPMEVISKPGQVTIIAEWAGQIRRVFTDGRGHPPDPDPTYQGHSIGHWEADTLVIDTIGVRGDTVFDSSGLGHSDKMTVKERMRMVAPGVLEDQITVTDPETFTRPWTVTRRYKRAAPDLQIMEYVCQENNRNPVGADGTTGIVLQGPGR